MDNQEIATEVMEWLREGREGIMEQAPLLAQEIIRFEYVSTSMMLAFSIGGCLLLWRLSKYAKRAHDQIDASIGFMFCCVAMAVPLLGFVVSSILLARVIIAPKVVVLDALMAMLRDG